MNTKTSSTSVSAINPLNGFIQFKLLKVSKDYHIQLEHNFYSVPYQLIGKKVEVWFGAKVVTITYEGKTVATHPKLLSNQNTRGDCKKS